MNKITEQEIKEYVSEVGELEKEHRKYSSFYCWVSHTFTQACIDELKESGMDASDFLGVCVTMNGMWDDNNGTEWHSTEFQKVEEYQELVPEQVIPAHYIKKQKTTEFKPVWE